MLIKHADGNDVGLKERKLRRKLTFRPMPFFRMYSLEDMALKYPISELELQNINGVGEGKAKRYGGKFISLIKTYVDENDITTT